MATCDPVADRKQHREEVEEDQDLVLLMAKDIGLSILDRGLTRETALALARDGLALAERMTAHFEAQAPPAESVACKEGCCYCCFYQVVLTPLEALLIGNHVDEAFSKKDKKALKERISRTLSLTVGKSREERIQVWHETPCIFLERGRCSLYEVRPFVCRAWHSLNAGHCKEAFDSRDPWQGMDCHAHRYHIFESVRAGINTATTELGCQGGTMEMATAIEQYLNGENPTEAWLQGEPVFAASSLNGPGIRSGRMENR
ncbi:MAG: YkgJ family cysteine cluster protein [Thermodesulfobacteriota bacterium]|nr:YkgJ family cysteine cluster protein [Thermodesulfobacteriota bacterium]